MGNRSSLWLRPSGAAGNGRTAPERPAGYAGATTTGKSKRPVATASHEILTALSAFPLLEGP